MREKMLVEVVRVWWSLEGEGEREGEVSATCSVAASASSESERELLMLLLLLPGEESEMFPQPSAHKE